MKSDTQQDNPWPVFLVLLLGCFITIEAASFQAPAMPSIAKHFGINADVTALVILLYYLGLVVFCPICGRIADRFGRKRVITNGMAIFCVSEFMAALAPSYPILLVARFIQGFSVACILPIVLSYIMVLFPDKNRGMALGVLASAMALGGASGAIIGGIVIDYFGWRSIYWISGSLAIIGLLLIKWRIPETPTTERSYRLDIRGAFLLLIAVGALLSVPTWVSRYGFLSPQAIGALCAGLGAFFTLWHIEQKVSSPVVDIRILRQRQFILAGLMYILFLICYGGSIYTLAFFITGRPEGSASQVGTVNTAIFICSMIGALVSGKLIDNFNERTVVFVTISILITGLLLYRTIDIVMPLTSIILITCMLGFAQGMKGPAITKLALATIPEKQMSGGSGLFSMMRDFGTPAGVSLGLALFTSHRMSATESALNLKASELGLNPELLSQFKQAYESGGLEQFPILSDRLIELGVDFNSLLDPVKYDAISTVMPMIGSILIGVCAVILLMAFFLPKSSKANLAQES